MGTVQATILKLHASQSSPLRLPKLQPRLWHTPDSIRLQYTSHPRRRISLHQRYRNTPRSLGRCCHRIFQLHIFACPTASPVQLLRCSQKPSGQSKPVSSQSQQIQQYNLRDCRRPRQNGQHTQLYGLVKLPGILDKNLDRIPVRPDDRPLRQALLLLLNNNQLSRISADIRVRFCVWNGRQ